MNKQNVAAATPGTAMVLVGKVGALEIVTPDLTPAAMAAKESLAVYEAYKGVITNEQEKFFINDELVKIKKAQKLYANQLASITDPLVTIRRDALKSKNAAENVFAALMTYLATGERILKGEIVRYEQLIERQRKEEEAQVQRAAAEERRRLETAARLEAEAAAEKNIEAQKQANLLELEGKTEDAELVRFRAEVQLEASAEKVEQTLEEASYVTDNAIVPTTSVKMAGTSLTGRWVADVVDVAEIFAGIAAKTTPMEAVRVKINGRLLPVPAGSLQAVKIESIEVSLAFFNDRARKEMDQFNYRGMKARYDQDLRVSA